MVYFWEIISCYWYFLFWHFTNYKSIKTLKYHCYFKHIRMYTYYFAISLSTENNSIYLHVAQTGRIKYTVFLVVQSGVMFDWYSSNSFRDRLFHTVLYKIKSLQLNMTMTKSWNDIWWSTVYYRSCQSYVFTRIILSFSCRSWLL